MVGTGYRVFDVDPETLKWAVAARGAANSVASEPVVLAANLRHGKTWFVGVDVLPNGPDGSINGVALSGAWMGHVALPQRWHQGQLSIVFPGYPGQDSDESHANHRYRINRAAAHVDGLLPVGSARRRFLREPHAFVLGLPLNEADAAPLMVWPGSHRIMGEAFRATIGEDDPASVDLTDTYHTARRQCFDRTDPVPINARPGQAVLLHRHLLHGVAPWGKTASAPKEGRMIAYFRPQFSESEWLMP